MDGAAFIAGVRARAKLWCLVDKPCFVVTADGDTRTGFSEHIADDGRQIWCFRGGRIGAEQCASNAEIEDDEGFSRQIASENRTVSSGPFQIAFDRRCLGDGSKPARGAKSVVGEPWKYFC